MTQSTASPSDRSAGMMDPLPSGGGAFFMSLSGHPLFCPLGIKGGSLGEDRHSSASFDRSGGGGPVF